MFYHSFCVYKDLVVEIHAGFIETFTSYFVFLQLVLYVAQTEAGRQLILFRLVPFLCDRTIRHVQGIWTNGCGEKQLICHCIVYMYLGT